jgi:hypothetical protein
MMDSLEKVLDTYEGRRVIWDILAKCRIFQNAAITGNLISDNVFFQLGIQSVGQQIFADIKPDTFRLMQEENKIRVESEGEDEMKAKDNKKNNKNDGGKPKK